MRYIVFKVFAALGETHYPKKKAKCPNCPGSPRLERAKNPILQNHKADKKLCMYFSICNKSKRRRWIRISLNCATSPHVYFMERR